MSPFIFEDHKQRRKIREERYLHEIFFLRRMEEEDIPEILAIEKLSFPNPWKESTFRGEIDNKPISFPCVIVHKTKKEVIGYIIFWRLKEEVHINNIALHPDYRRKGIGEAVLGKVLAQVEREGAKYVTLEVRPSNISGLALYRKLEFKVLGIRRGYYHNPREDAIVLGKRL